jgi:hypothetical protein
MSLFQVDDGYELHVGAEWARPDAGGRVFALRAGVWGESAERVRYEGENPRLAGRYLEGSPIVHGAAGVGWTTAFAGDGESAFAPSSLSLDLGADYSSRRAVVSGSVVVRF